MFFLFQRNNGVRFFNTFQFYPICPNQCAQFCLLFHDARIILIMVGRQLISPKLDCRSMENSQLKAIKILIEDTIKAFLRFFEFRF